MAETTSKGSESNTESVPLSEQQTNFPAVLDWMRENPVINLVMLVIAYKLTACVPGPMQKLGAQCDKAGIIKFDPTSPTTIENPFKKNPSPKEAFKALCEFGQGAVDKSTDEAQKAQIFGELALNAYRYMVFELTRKCSKDGKKGVRIKEEIYERTDCESREWKKEVVYEGECLEGEYKALKILLEDPETTEKDLESIKDYLELAIYYFENQIKSLEKIGADSKEIDSINQTIVELKNLLNLLKGKSSKEPEVEKEENNNQPQNNTEPKQRRQKDRTNDWSDVPEARMRKPNNSSQTKKYSPEKTNKGPFDRDLNRKLLRALQDGSGYSKRNV